MFSWKSFSVWDVFFPHQCPPFWVFLILLSTPFLASLPGHYPPPPPLRFLGRSQGMSILDARSLLCLILSSPQLVCKFFDGWGKALFVVVILLA